MFRCVGRWSRRVGPCALLVLALSACSGGDEVGSPTPEPPAYPTLATFVATVSPAEATTPIGFRWDPEPRTGQGTATATFALVDLAEGVVGVTAEHCATFVSDVVEYDPDSAVSYASVDRLPSLQAITEQGSLGTVTSFGGVALDGFAAEVSRSQSGITLGQTVEDWIFPVGDRDTFYFHGIAGQSVAISMDRLSGDLDPYLELVRFSDTGQTRISFNNDGGAGKNALINNFLLPASATYGIIAQGASGTGKYRLRLSQSVPLVPTPRINRVSPASAVATPFGSDFWVAIYGEGFHRDAAVRWNGQLRSKFYSSPFLIYIRVRAADIGLLPAPPRQAFISVVNPGPGGGSSNSYPFSIQVPFLGETELLAPAARSSSPVGSPVTFSAAWTHPTDSWRTMRHMDLRLRDPDDRIVAWVRVVEGEGATSTFSLLDDAGAVVDAGLPGEERTLAGELVTLDLATSAIGGSGQTVTIDPVLSFATGAEGTYSVEVLIEDKSGDTQDIEVLGQFVLVPEGCHVPIGGVTIALESVAP